MLRHCKFLMAALLALPLSAHATLYNFEYTGYVAYLNGNGLGHYVGQEVSGNLKFDLANAYDDDFPESFVTGYRARAGLDFVTGYLPPSTNRNMDSVYAYDSIDANHAYHSDGGIKITDGLYTEYSNAQAPGSRNYGLEIDISFDDFDWLTNGKLNEFSFNESDFFEAYNCSGLFYDFNDYTKPDGAKVYDFDGASFRFYSAKLTQVDASEPSSLWLLLCGGFIFYLIRTFNFYTLQGRFTAAKAVHSKEYSWR